MQGSIGLRVRTSSRLLSSIDSTAKPATCGEVEIPEHESAPEPDAIQRGTQPKMKAKEVIKVGRSLSRAPSSAASRPRKKT